MKKVLLKSVLMGAFSITSVFAHAGSGQVGSAGDFSYVHCKAEGFVTAKDGLAPAKETMVVSAPLFGETSDYGGSCSEEFTYLGKKMIACASATEVVGYYHFDLRSSPETQYKLVSLGLGTSAIDSHKLVGMEREETIDIPLYLKLNEAGIDTPITIEDGNSWNVEQSIKKGLKRSVIKANEHVNISLDYCTIE